MEVHENGSMTKNDTTAIYPKVGKKASSRTASLMRNVVQIFHETPN